MERGGAFRSLRIYTVYSLVVPVPVGVRTALSKPSAAGGSAGPAAPLPQQSKQNSKVSTKILCVNYLVKYLLSLNHCNKYSKNIEGHFCFKCPNYFYKPRRFVFTNFTPLNKQNLRYTKVRFT